MTHTRSGTYQRVVEKMMTLRHMPIPFRALFSSFLALIGIGYIAALSLLFLVNIRPHLGTKQTIVQDIAQQYHGLPDNTRLEVALKGAMSSMASSEDRTRIIDWIHGGATQQGFITIAPIFKNNCAVCHNPQNNKLIPNLNNYNEIKKVVRTDTGGSIVQLARVSHIHLFGISLIFIVTGTIFAFSETPVSFRAAIVAIPYLTIVIDTGSWWLTKYLSPAFAWTVLGGGAVMGVALAVQIFIPLWEMWSDLLISGLRYLSGGFRRRLGTPAE
jgi:hypothetical protein